MEHFVRITMEKQEEQKSLDESIFAEQEMYETKQGGTVYQIPLARNLSEQEADEYANRLANYMFEQGYKDFDIDISADGLEETDEITYDDDDDFFEDFGVMWFNEDDDPIDEAEYQGRKVKLNKIMQGDSKKFKVYVKNDKGNVVKVNFGQGGDAKGGTMRIRKSNPKARKAFRARHNCDNPGPKYKARYWSCRKW